MKKIISVSLASVLIALAIVFCTVSSDLPAAAAGGSAKGGPEHHFTFFVGYDRAKGEHSYMCTDPGCFAVITEKCAFREFCGLYLDKETMPCSTCGYGKIYIHDFEFTHDSSDGEYRHRLRCVNTDPEGIYGACGKTNGEAEPCRLGKMQIWRHFDTWYAPYGHRLTRECFLCGFQYGEGTYYPPLHPKSFSTENKCEICSLSYPYHTDFEGLWFPDGYVFRIPDPVDLEERGAVKTGNIFPKEGDVFYVKDSESSRLVYSFTIPHFVVTRQDPADGRYCDTVYEGTYDYGAYRYFLGKDSPGCENCTHAYTDAFTVTYKNSSERWYHDRFLICGLCGHVDFRGTVLCPHNYATCRGACCS